MRVAHAFLALATTLTTARGLVAQAAGVERGEEASGGNLTPGITYELVQARDGSTPHERQWISAVVLWRGRPGNLDGTARPNLIQRDTVRQRAAERDYRRLQRAAEDSGRWFLERFSVQFEA